MICSFIQLQPPDVKNLWWQKRAWGFCWLYFKAHHTGCRRPPSWGVSSWGDEAQGPAPALSWATKGPSRTPGGLLSGPKFLFAYKEGISSHLLRECKFAMGEGNGNPLQCSCLGSPKNGGAWGLQSTGSQRVGHDWVTSLTSVCYVTSVSNMCVLLFLYSGSLRLPVLHVWINLISHLLYYIFKIWFHGNIK